MDAVYTTMLQYVEAQLKEYDAHGGVNKNKISYSRMDHTRRVYRWMLTLYEAYEQKEELDIDALKIATIFHDVGYCDIERGEHANRGAVICREYLNENGFAPEKIDFVCDLIARHSDKQLLHSDIPMELVLLMEADLLDDTGAHGVVMDVWMDVAVNGKETTFESICEHINRFSVRQMQENPMRTEEGKRIWERKRRLVNAFYEEYANDLKQL